MAAPAPIQINVAGVTYNAGKHMSAADMEKLTHVQLLPEPDNEYDKTAIAVYVRDGGGQQVKIGYVPVDYLPTAHYGKWADRAWKIADCGHLGRGREKCPYFSIEETQVLTPSPAVKAVAALIVAPKNKTVLELLPTDHLPRPKKKTHGVTKGMCSNGKLTPWDLVGGSLQSEETPEQGIKRFLAENTGLSLDDIGAVLVGQEYIPDCKSALLVYTVSSEVPLQAGPQIEMANWASLVPRDDRCYRFERALCVAKGLLESIDYPPPAKKSRTGK